MTTSSIFVAMTSSFVSTFFCYTTTTSSSSSSILTSGVTSNVIPPHAHSAFALLGAFFLGSSEFFFLLVCTAGYKSLRSIICCKNYQVARSFFLPILPISLPFVSLRRRLTRFTCKNAARSTCPISDLRVTTTTISP